jgi:Zn finger protein HypA/HybF involved in hydrogenase expression
VHEKAVVRSLTDLVRKHLPPHATLEAAVVEVGALENLDSEPLERAWETLTRNQDLAGSSLRLEVVPIRVRCRVCALHFAPEDPGYLVCPRCGDDHPTVLSGRGVTLVRLVAAIPDGTPLEMDPIHARALHVEDPEDS